jgi:hypothetical protein
MGLEVVELALPGGAPLRHPTLQRIEGGGPQAAHSHPAHLLGAHQAAAFEHREVLHHRRQGHGERFGKLAHRGRSATQAFDHLSPGGVGQRAQGPVHGRHTLKHGLNYKGGGWAVKGIPAGGR